MSWETVLYLLGGVAYTVIVAAVAIWWGRAHPKQAGEIADQVVSIKGKL